MFAEKQNWNFQFFVAINWLIKRFHLFEIRFVLVQIFIATIDEIDWFKAWNKKQKEALKATIQNQNDEKSNEVEISEKLFDSMKGFDNFEMQTLIEKLNIVPNVFIRFYYILVLRQILFFSLLQNIKTHLAFTDVHIMKSLWNDTKVWNIDCCFLFFFWTWKTKKMKINVFFVLFGQNKACKSVEFFFLQNSKSLTSGDGRLVYEKFAMVNLHIDKLYASTAHTNNLIYFPWHN